MKNMDNYIGYCPIWLLGLKLILHDIWWYIDAMPYIWYCNDLWFMIIMLALAALPYIV